MLHNRETKNQIGLIGVESHFTSSLLHPAPARLDYIILQVFPPLYNREHTSNQLLKLLRSLFINV